MLPILKFFAFKHLPPALAAVSEPFSALAHQLAEAMPPSAELSAGLRKLLESKDCAVRAALHARADVLRPVGGPGRSVEGEGWQHIGGDLEARRLPGDRYVDIRVRGSEASALFLGAVALQNAYSVFEGFDLDDEFGQRKIEGWPAPVEVEGGS